MDDRTHHPDPPEDDALVRAALDGDENALAGLVDRHWHRVHGKMRSALGPGEDALDATQEAFVLACRHLTDLRSPERFGAWVRSIAANTARKWLGKRRLERLRFVPPEAMKSLAGLAADADPDGSAAGAGTLKQAMTDLTAEDRTVTTLFYFVGLSQRSIARVLCIPVGTVKSRLSRSRKQLRRSLSMANEHQSDAQAESCGREVIGGMRGLIQWEKLLTGKGLDGWRVGNEGAWTREGDVILGEDTAGEAGPIVIGDSSWDDYELSVLITPISGGNAQVFFRMSADGKRWYLFDMLLGWQAVAISRVDMTAGTGPAKLSVVNCPLQRGQEYHVLIAARGASLTTYVDGKLYNQLTDAWLSAGPIGLNIWESKTAFRDPRIRHMS